MRKLTLLVVLLIVASSARISEASGRKQLWNINLLKLVGQAGDPESEYVWGLAFSPDDTRLAIGFNRLGDAGASNVIIVAVDNPKAVLRGFAPPGPARGLELFVPGSIQWSPSGKLLAAYRRVLSLESERSCLAPADFEFGGFLAADRIVFAKRGLTGQIQVRRPDCSIEDDWQMPNGFSYVWGTCPQAGFIGIQTVPDWPKAETMETHLLSYPGHTTTRQWTWDGSATQGGMILADSCKAICAGESHLKEKNTSHDACWSTNSGAKIADDARLTRTDEQAFDGSGGALVAVTVSRSVCRDSAFWRYLDMDGCASRTTRRVLWNIETNEEVLSWPVLSQQLSIRGRKASDPFGVALSSTGKYLAEGGAGRVRLYALQ